MNSECKHVREELAAYQAGWLPEPRSAEIGAHLAECAGCAHQLALDARVVSAAQELPALQPPHATWERVLAERTGQASSEARRARPVRRWRPAMALATTALVAIGAGVWLRAPHGSKTDIIPPPTTAATATPPADDSTFVLAHTLVSAGAMAGDPNRAVLISASAHQATP